jgi:threonyl-tRNA synthetase
MDITLPDGSTIQVPDGATTADVAAAISEGLARQAIGGRVLHDGHTEIYDLHRPLPGDCQLRILTATDDDSDSLQVLRHSAAHVMAEAVCNLFPETKLVYGPPLEDGFYYDIDLDHSISTEDFPRIEEEMERIIKEKRPFRRHEMNRKEGMEKLRAEGSRYKIENAERADGDTLSFYITGEDFDGDFEDLCRGPHLPSTGLIKAFKIRQVSRSYYRGDIHDIPLQRVYGTAFFKKSSLHAYLQQLEEAKKRDHRVLGRQLELFAFSEEVGGGMALWLPKGTVVRTELQKFLTEEMMKLGYEMVVSPHIARLKLFRTSGHFPYYKDSQFPALYESEAARMLNELWEATLERGDADGLSQREQLAIEELDRLGPRWRRRLEELNYRPAGGHKEANQKAVENLLEESDGYLLKPMNCPHHIAMYASRPRSYRDLPLRYGEYGTVYRWEQSGELTGLTRVRAFTQDDAHLFCTNEHLAEEVLATVRLSRLVLETLGLKDYRVRVGLRDAKSDKYVGSTENWVKAEEAIREAAKASGMEYKEEIGEAAFYGPKIDFIVKDCIGRSWQLGTVQVDYNLPERFGLTYVGPDNQPHVPIMIHRAPFGSLERFLGILIEHFAGAFPLWLSPVQVGVASVSEKSAEYAVSVRDKLKAAGLRAEVDTGSEKIGPKKHRYRTAKVNYILVVGEREAAENSLNVNDRGGRTIGNMTIDAFVAGCKQEIACKSLNPLVGSDR